ncbi:LPS export ABC transporter permease LptF [Acidocella facilis]|uniref:LPS export ABC transporter permease LptF n=1 Tax=Acidocella facilis TaxID=525 RepID=UPI00047A39DA|nr:LPS export ABC transporter permease LptF [Acidocella facilis]
MQALPFLHRLDRYVLSQLALALALVTTGLVALIWLTQSLRFIQIIVSHGLSPFVFVKLTALLVPSFLSTILPITCFIVVLFIYVRLSGDRELTIMRGIGLSDLKLARPALALALAVTLLGYGLSLGVVPATLSTFRTYQYEIRNQIAAFLLEPGVFTPVSANIMVYVQSRDPAGGLKGIIIEDNRDPNAPATILARTGELITTAQGPVVVLENGSREQIDPKTGQLDMLTFERNTLSLAQAARAGGPVDNDAAEEPLGALLHPPATMEAGDRAKWIVEAQRRLTAPLSTLGYTLVALVAALGGTFRRHGGITRIIGAVVIVTALVALGLGVNNLAARNLALLPLIWVWAVIPGLVSLYLLLRQGAPRA